MLVKDEWRTASVVGLCEAIRQDNDYSLTPILADALEEAGCNNEELLSRLRTTREDLEAQRLVAIVYSYKTHRAVERIEEMAEKLGPNTGYEEDYGPSSTIEMNYQVLMEAATAWLDGVERVGYKGQKHWNSQNYITQIGSESWRDEFPRMAKEFWKCYTTITGVVTGDKGSFFSCSC